MKRIRLATWSALAGLGLIAGCQTCSNDCCNTCNSCGNGGLLSRLGLRPRTGGAVMYDGPVGGAPVGGAPYMGGDYPCSTTGAGPIFDGQSPFMTIPGGAMPPGMTTLPPGMTTLPPGMTTLPPPMPGAAPPLAPVPYPNGTAPATPAPPSQTSRRG
jgi:hypothetical protein